MPRGCFIARGNAMFGKFVQGVVSTFCWELWGRDQQNALVNKSLHGKHPPNKGPPENAVTSLLAVRRERKLRKQSGGQNEDFKGGFYLARCSRGREPER